MMKKAAFIGTGNMGGALIDATCRALGAEQVVIADHVHAKALTLAQRLGCSAAPNNAEAVRGAAYIFLCVKPQIMGQVASALVSTLNECHGRDEDKAIISIAAGLHTETIRSYLPALDYEIPILRVMPNTCAAIGQGMLALTAAPGTAEAHMIAVEEILSCAGRMERISEGLMEQFAAIAGCGPAYVYQFIEALADGGVMAGLPRQQAQIYAAQTLLGAAAMVLESGQHPGALKDAVCSPGGSTIAGVAALERGGLRAAAIDAVMAAYRRNVELGQL